LGSRERVVEFLSRSGVRYEVREFDESTKSSALAAKALGCTVGEIAKSVVFVGDRTSVVIASGDKRVSLAKLNDIAGVSRIASPEEVRDKTGYPIGGVPPFPHADGVLVLADLSLTRFASVWAAAGGPNSVFKVGTEDLLRLLGGGQVDVCE
jgi:prolyl-tRNA editing enzyme YbaK/EbsC (Cys-tRNA(Pro) deacylase)